MRWYAMVVPVVIMGLLAAQSIKKEEITMKDCYGDCVAMCLVVDPTPNTLSCAVKCLTECILPPTPYNGSAHGRNQYFCRLGCATVFCAHISTVENPAAEEVEGCAESCSSTCAMN